MAALVHDIPRGEVLAAIGKLIDNLVNIKDETGEFLLRLDDGRVIDTKGWNDWEWTHGIGLFGLYRYYEQTNDPHAYEVMLKWFADRFAAGTPTKNINTMSPFLTLAYLTRRPATRAICPISTPGRMADGPGRAAQDGRGRLPAFRLQRRDPGELWDDTLMMSVLPLAKIGLLLGRPHYVEEAKRQFLVHIKYLTDRTNRAVVSWLDLRRTPQFRRCALGARQLLGHHRHPPRSSRCSIWSRATACAPSCSTRWRRRCGRWPSIRNSSGLWHTLIVDPTSYLEASATAGFAYGILKAVRKTLSARRLSAGRDSGDRRGARQHRRGGRAQAGLVRHGDGRDDAIL